MFLRKLLTQLSVKPLLPRNLSTTSILHNKNSSDTSEIRVSLVKRILARDIIIYSEIVRKEF